MADTDKTSTFLTPTRLFYGSLALVVISWATVLAVGLFSGSGGREKGAMIGELFGVVGCLFTGLAFVGAGVAAYLQREQLLEQRRQILRTAESERTAGIEGRFFQLLDSWQAMVNTISVTEESNKGTLPYVGRQAIIRLFERLESNQKNDRRHYAHGTKIADDARFEDIRVAYRMFYDGKKVDGRFVSPASGYAIGNYFRLLYHILKYIRENVKSEKDRKFYKRVVRAHLSSPELVLLLYNGLSDWGYPKMFHEMNAAELLHNLQDSSVPDADDLRLYQVLKPPLPDGWVAVKS